MSMMSILHMMSVTFFSACDFCNVHVGLDDGDILVMFFTSMKFTVVLMTVIGRDKHDTLTPYCL
jgi:hypothetical protein